MPTFQNKRDYLFVEIREPYSRKVFLAIIHEIAHRCQEEKLDKVLIDARAVDDNPNIFERFQIGVEIAKTWGLRFKVACVAKPETTNRMAETTAVNRGARVLATSNMDDALKWLEVESNNESTGA